MLCPCEILRQVAPEEAEAARPLHSSAVDGDGGVFSFLLPDVHYQFLGLSDAEGEAVLLAAVCQDAVLLSLHRSIAVDLGEPASSAAGR